MTVQEFQARKVLRVARTLAHFIATTHGGQVNFVQLLLGDKESHIPPSAFK